MERLWIRPGGGAIALALLIGCAQPAAHAALGVGDGQGDAKVAGTPYDATAEVSCSGYRKHPAGHCPAGVLRHTETGLTVVEIKWPDGDSRALYFDAKGQSAGADTSQADGSAAYDVIGTRRGDTTVVTIGPERYEIPDAFVVGD